MKSIKKIIYIIAILYIAMFTSNVNAVVIDINSCRFTISGPTNPVEGYPLYMQKLVCGNKEFDFYCIDAGISNPKSASNMNVSYVKSNGLNSILGSDLSYFQKQVALRRWAYKVGLNTYYTNSMKKIVEKGYDDEKFEKGWDIGDKAGTDLKTIKVSGDTVFNLLVTNVTRDESGNFNAVVSVSLLDSSIDLSKVSWSSSNANVNPSNDGKTLTISGTMQECKGMKVKLQANVSVAITNGNPGNQGGSGSSGNSGGDRTPYIYLVPETGKIQAGIVYLGSEDIIFTEGNDKDGGKDGYGGDDGYNGADVANNVYNLTINIPDPNCDCGADYSGAFKCDGAGRSTEYLHETSHIISCIISGNYNDYCNSSIEKTKDNNGSTLKTTNLSDKVEEYSIDLTDNNYCRVYCKEDIDYSLPGKIQANNGRYFTLRQGNLDAETNKPIVLKGTRSCYTDEINIALFKEHVIAKQKEIISNYNDWLKYKAYSESAENAEEEEKGCSKKTCSNGVLSNAGAESMTYYSYEGTSVDYTPYKVDGSINSNGTSSLQLDSSKSVTASWEDSISGSETAGTCGNSSYISSCPKLTKTITPEDKAKEYDNKAAESLRKAKAAEEQLEEILKKYKSCYEWNNNYCFEPEVTFEYEDGKIYEDVNNQKLVGSKTSYEDNAYAYVNVNSDNEYNGDGDKLSLEEKNYIYLNGESLDQQKVKVNLTHSFVKKVAKATKTFDKSKVKVCTYHTAGTIVTGNDCDDRKNTITLGSDGYVFPITLQKEESRQYNYNLKFTNIGVAGNDDSFKRGNAGSCKGGRLMGCQDGQDVYESKTKRKDAKYVCQYSSCPECKTTCVCPDDSTSCYVEDEICYFDNCPTCVASCVGCLWSKDDIAFGYKQISLSDVFPNSDTNEVGYNWNTDPNINPQAEKVKETIKEIEEDKTTGAEKIYSKPEYSYTLSPSTMAKIREYNKAANAKKKKRLDSFGNVDTGGYNNDTLICNKGAECKSAFLNGLDKIVGKKNRVRNEKWTSYEDGSAWK